VHVLSFYNDIAKNKKQEPAKIIFVLLLKNEDEQFPAVKISVVGEAAERTEKIFQ
jgi:hypothetical protein